MVLTLFGTAYLLYWLTPQSLARIQVPAFTDKTASGTKITVSHQLSADELTKKMSSVNSPVIGSGPLTRVVQIVKQPTGSLAVDPFSGQVTQKLSDNDLNIINGHQYAIQLYGQTTAKQIALTFDDGPDPVYTPQLLDLLSRHHVPASFFEIGKNVVKYPEIAQREAAEGHIIGNHTFNHVDFNYTDSWRSVQEINQTQRTIRAVTQHNTAYFRPPYVGNDEQSLRDGVKSIIYAQQLGYTVTSYNYDSDDWQFPLGVKPKLPKLDGSTQVILLHDGGGDRSRTIAYVEALIKQARSQGYQFVNLSQLYPQNPPLFSNITPTLADTVSNNFFRLMLVWPHTIVINLFMFTLGLIVVTVGSNIVLSTLYLRRNKFGRRAKNYKPYVTAIIPAYNEEKVIGKTVRSLLRSRYKNFDIIIVDDGSKDGTWQTIQQLARKSDRITAFKQTNRGKAAALNKGISKAKGEIIICLDADTVFLPTTIPKLVRHFIDPAIGAVAGSVRVGNVQNMLTRWQGLEYITSINIERTAHALLRSILIVPGACGAWRKQALIKAKRYSSATLAEDCDLTLRLHRTGYKIIQDNQAVSFTEAPLALRGLTKQRFRWVFGNIQAYWKNRDMFFRRRYGWLGMYVLPNALLSTIIPLLFWPLLMMVALENLADGRFKLMLIFLLAVTALNFLVACFGLLLSRERPSYLLAVPFSRLIYGPIRTYLLYATLITALKGVYVGWNKLSRTGTVKPAKSLRLAHLKAGARA